MHREDVALGEQPRKRHALGTVPRLDGNLGNVVIHHMKADRARDLRDATTDPSEAEDPKDKFVHLPQSNDVLPDLIPLLLRDRLIKEEPRSQCITKKTKHILDDRLGVCIRCRHHLHPARATCRQINVVDADPRATDDSQARKHGEECGVHLRVGAHDEPLNFVCSLDEAMVIDGCMHQFAACAEPIRCLFGEVLRHHHQRLRGAGIRASINWIRLIHADGEDRRNRSSVPSENGALRANPARHNRSNPHRRPHPAESAQSTGMRQANRADPDP